MTREYKQSSFREARKVQEELKKWLVRRVECVRGSLTLGQYKFWSLKMRRLLIAEQTLRSSQLSAMGRTSTRLRSSRSNIHCTSRRAKSPPSTAKMSSYN